MARRLREAVMARWLSGLLVSVTMVAVVSGLIALLDPHVPVLSLLVLYILVVLPAGRHGRLPGDGGGGGRADGPGAARGAGVGAPLGGAGGVAAGGDPAVLAEGGLGPALRTLARRSAVPVELEVGTQARLPERVEVTAYHVVSEALTNVAKHADASVARVDVEAGGGLLRVCVRDDGVGGADPPAARAWSG